jgi:hypothetical protein
MLWFPAPEGGPRARRLSAPTWLWSSLARQEREVFATGPDDRQDPLCPCARADTVASRFDDDRLITMFDLVELLPT